MAPFGQAAVVEHFHAVIDNEGDSVIFQTFLKHYQPAHAPVAVLKWMDRLKSVMEVYDLFQTVVVLLVIASEQLFDFLSYGFRSCGLFSGFVAFSGMFQVFPVRIAPGILF